MKIFDSKLTYFKTNIPILFSAGIGGIFCVICDYFAKEHDSFIFSMIQKMSSQLFIPALLGFLLIAVFLPLLSIALCFVIEPAKKLTAFYLGASILALIFNFTPVTEFAQLKSTENSAKIIVSVSNPANRDIPYALVTVKDRDTKNIVGQTKYQRKGFFFYLDNGKYRMFMEIPGYEIIIHDIDVNNDRDIHLNFSLKPTLFPLQIQRLFIDY